MIAGNLIIHFADLVGILKIVQGALIPVPVWWLGLLAAAVVVFIFGILTKDLTLIPLASLMGTSNFAHVLTPTQMFVFALVFMIYIPCIATIAVLVKEFGYKRAALISLSEVGFAIALGGVLLSILTILGFS